MKHIYSTPPHQSSEIIEERGNKRIQEPEMPDEYMEMMP